MITPRDNMMYACVVELEWYLEGCQEFYVHLGGCQDYENQEFNVQVWVMTYMFLTRLNKTNMSGICPCHVYDCSFTFTICAR